MRRLSLWRVLALFALLLLLFPAGPSSAQEEAEKTGELPNLDTLTRVPLGTPQAAGGSEEEPGSLNEEIWRDRFRAIRGRIEREERLLAIKRAELYDKIEQGTTEKKPKRFAIEGFVINTKKSGDDQKFIDPLEREVFEREKALERLRGELRELEFEASVAGVPKEWRR